MANTTPYAGASDQRLADLINQDNQTALQLGVDFTFGPPFPYTDTQGRNTQITLFPVPGKMWPGPVTVHYTRMPLTVLNDLPPGYVSPVTIPLMPFTLYDIMDQINEALGLNLSTDEVVNVLYQNEQPFYRLPIKNSSSLAWIDSDYEFEAVFPNEDIPLSSVVTTTMLSGLVYAGPVHAS
jgi:hypothetical protein